MFVHRVHVVKCEKNGNGKICSRVIEQAALQVGHSQVCAHDVVQNKHSCAFLALSRPPHATQTKATNRHAV